MCMLGLLGFVLLQVHRAALWGPVVVAFAIAGALVGLGAVFVRAVRRSAERRRLHGQRLVDLDAMTGDRFEDWVLAALQRAGFDCENLPRTRDFGIDVVAQRGRLRIGVQVKRYGGAVGNGAVQQAIAGAGHHGCAAAAVVTQSRFTAAAREQARTARVPVVLIDRHGLDGLGATLRRLRA